MAEISENVRIGPYTILQALPAGRGGMARVYRARFDRRERAANDSQIVALKIVLTESSKTSANQARTYFEALNNEVELLKQLRHPNIVKLFPIPWGTNKGPYLARASSINGQPWFCVMEFLTEGSLHALIQEHGKLKLEDAVEIAYQIGLALDFVHSKDIAHLDVKPDNVLFRTGPGKDRPVEAVLIDFGVATRRFKYAIDAGAMPYLAPERLRIVRGETPPENVGDQRPTDVYSLGILLYRMLTAKMPFQSQSKDHLTSAILHDAPTRPSTFNRNIPPQIEDLILAALEKDPYSRPTANEFTERLEEAVPPPRWWLSPDLRPTPPPPRNGASNLVKAGGVLLSAVVTLGIGFWAGSAFANPNNSLSARVATQTTVPVQTAAPPRATLVATGLPQSTIETSAVKTVLAPTSTLVPTRLPTSTFTRTRTLSPTLPATPGGSVTAENIVGTSAP